MEITVKGETVGTRPKPQARAKPGVLAAAAMMIGALGPGRAEVAETRTLRLPEEVAPGIMFGRGRIRPTPIRGKPHRNPTPHRGTSRRANRNAKRRRARARAR